MNSVCVIQSVSLFARLWGMPQWTAVLHCQVVGYAPVDSSAALPGCGVCPSGQQCCTARLWGMPQWTAVLHCQVVVYVCPSVTAALHC